MRFEPRRIFIKFLAYFIFSIFEDIRRIIFSIIIIVKIIHDKITKKYRTE